MIILFTGADKLNFALYLCGASHAVLSHSTLEVREAFWCIMEVRNRLMQGVCRVVGKLVLEIAKSNGALVKIFGGLHLLQADGVLHEVIDTPTTAVGGLIIGLSSFGQRNMERGTFRVSPALFGLFAQKIRYTANIFHQTVRVFECISIDFLQNIAFLRCLFGESIRLVDMPFAIGDWFGHRAVPRPRG